MTTKDVNVMRRLASQMWGRVQRQKKITDGVYWFETAGHGGYIVDIELYPKLEEFHRIVTIRQGSSKYRPSEQHFAPLEEDCNWALVEYLYPDVLKNAYYKGSNQEKYTLEDRAIIVRESVERWNPEYL